MPVYDSLFLISKMDCPCEESLIRMKLDGNAQIVNLRFDLAERTLTVTHKGAVDWITQQLEELKLGSRLVISTSQCEQPILTQESERQRKTLWWVLIINALFFVLEMSTGIISGSMGLVADSLDMLADALVYGMSLLVVGAAVIRKKRVAKWSGYLQILLALWGLSEVVKRFVGLETPPDFRTMIVISSIALVANSICLYLLQRTKSEDAHMRASIIFSANDVIINLGVIVAGLLVWWLNSGIPDLIIGIVVFLIVIRGATRILKLAR